MADKEDVVLQYLVERPRNLFDFKKRLPQVDEFCINFHRFFVEFFDFSSRECRPPSPSMLQSL